MPNNVPAASGRDADLLPSSPYYEPLVGAVGQQGGALSPGNFQQDYYSAGGQLLNPSYNNTPLWDETYNGQAFGVLPNPLKDTAFMQNTDRTINAFEGEQDYGVLAPPAFTQKVAGGINTSGAGMIMGPTSLLTPSSGTSAPSSGGAGSPASSGPTVVGNQDGQPTGKTGLQQAGDVLNIFGNNKVIQQLLGLGGAAAVDKLVKVPPYPDMTEAASRILSQGPLTPAGQEAERRLTSYLQQGPQITPISEEYIASVSKMFDDELQHQLQIIDTKMQAAGAGGFGGGSGDSQYLRAQLINKYSLEKTFYIQKLLDERLRADLQRYYDTLTKVYGVSQEELQLLAGLEVEELAARFKLDYQDAIELKQALSGMLYQATQDDYTKQQDMLANYGARMLGLMTGAPAATGGAGGQ